MKTAEEILAPFVRERPDVMPFVGKEMAIQAMQEYGSMLILKQSEVFDKKQFAFAEWISEIGWKKYKEGWCQAGGSNGWHCTTKELYERFNSEG